ncbi:Bug family tripartite tricarboxylate transporter substrate binding protein [Variovorax saccharolyticus]|uniref:Bug family tripartite tricarboxylate transporter substrate binding protein n=1 Tax=Variovorax saccharolyticus TaxID=3053516 RepID=UPI002575EE44|nr:tripartite tricarboxylate transporter substrate binding protein [Variovorax sp. J22R187]MDM0022228.1 tripartite tricarboxylate transporter substrate binding protein [Variovorax sp. J22R187]
MTLYAIRLAALSMALTLGAAAAQEPYPSKPITVVVPFGAGAGTDVITRTITDRMARQMGATIVVDNKAGASGQIGTEFVARAQPDGYTLLVATNSTHSGNPYLFKKLRYDPVKSFAPVGRMTINPLALLVRQDSPFKSAGDLVRFAQQHPDKLSYGYGNTGGQVSSAMLINMAKIKALAVPYKTTPQAFTDLLSGQIDFTFVDIAASQALIDGGKIRALGVTSPNRFTGMGNVPALRETPGLEDFALFAWLGLVAPAGTPAPVIVRLNAELRAALDSPEVKQKLEQRTGSIVEPTTSVEFSSFLREQGALWKRRIGEAGIQPE